MKKLSSPIDLIKKSINIFFDKENLVYFLKVSSVAVPFSILSIVHTYLVTNKTLNSEDVWVNVTSFVITIIQFFVYILVSAAGIEAIRRVVNKEKVVFKDTFSVAKKKFWKFLLLSLLLGLIVGFGFALLIIPGIIFMVWYTFSQFILIENSPTKVRVALSKSKKLVQGNFWKVLGRMFVFGVFSLIIELIISLVPYNVGSIVTGLIGTLFVLPHYLLYKELND